MDKCNGYCNIMSKVSPNCNSQQTQIKIIASINIQSNDPTSSFQKHISKKVTAVHLKLLIEAKEKKGII